MLKVMYFSFKKWHHIQMSSCPSLNLSKRTHLDLFITLFLELLVLCHQQAFKATRLAEFCLRLLQLPAQFIIISYRTEANTNILLLTHILNENL